MGWLISTLLTVALWIEGRLSTSHAATAPRIRAIAELSSLWLGAARYVTRTTANAALKPALGRPQKPASSVRTLPDMPASKNPPSTAKIANAHFIIMAISKTGLTPELSGGVAVRLERVVRFAAALHSPSHRTRRRIAVRDT